MPAGAYVVTDDGTTAVVTPPGQAPKDAGYEIDLDAHVDDFHEAVKQVIARRRDILIAHGRRGSYAQSHTHALSLPLGGAEEVDGKHRDRGQVQGQDHREAGVCFRAAVIYFDCPRP